MQKIWPRLNRRTTATQLKLQRNRLSTIIGVIMWHWRIGLEHFTNDFCRICGDEKEVETFLHLLCTYPAIGRKRKRHLGVWYMEDLDELSCLDPIAVRVASSEASSGS